MQLQRTAGAPPEERGVCYLIKIGNGFDLLNSMLITVIVKGREANHVGKQNACGWVGPGDGRLPILHLLVNGSWKDAQ